MPVAASRLVTQQSPSTARRICDFIRGFSMEATRLGAGDLTALQSSLPARTQVYLTAIPSRPYSELIEPAVRLHALGFDPVPHLAARRFADRQALDDFLSRLAEVGVRRVLAIAGDQDRSEGPFGAAIDLIESGLLQRHGIAEVGIAAYPQGHPRLTEVTLARALAAKIEAAEQTGLRVHIVTQFAFEAAAILGWLRRLRDLGFDHPVRVGMAGPTSLSNLLRYARRCGVRATAQGLTRHAGLVKHLVGRAAPDGIIRPLADACAAGGLGRVEPHFFSFGGAAATARWAAAVAAGRIVLDRASGFGVEPL